MALPRPNFSRPKRMFEFVSWQRHPDPKALLLGNSDRGAGVLSLVEDSSKNNCRGQEDGSRSRKSACFFRRLSRAARTHCVKKSCVSLLAEAGATVTLIAAITRTSIYIYTYTYIYTILHIFNMI